MLSDRFRAASARVAWLAPILAGTLVAKAADLPYSDPYGASIATRSVYDWTGFYVGGHGGYGWGSTGGIEMDGFLGGVQGGYNMQNGQFLIGLEGDIGLSNIDRSKGRRRG